MASYISWIEAAGARAALVSWDATDDELSTAFDQLSGLVLPGGSCGIHNTAYGNATFKLLDMAAAAGDFPVHTYQDVTGNCLPRSCRTHV